MGCSVPIELKDNQWVKQKIDISQVLPKGTIILADSPVYFPGDSESKEKNGTAKSGIIILNGDKSTYTEGEVYLFKASYEVMTDSLDLFSEYQKLFKTKKIPLFYLVG